MASPGDIVPLDHHNEVLGCVGGAENEFLAGNEQVGEQRLPADHEEASTAGSSTGSTPAPVPPLELPLNEANKTQKEVPNSQKPPKITPRGIRRIKPLQQKEGVFIQPWEFK
jgi:hypothetical protein